VTRGTMIAMRRTYRRLAGLLIVAGGAAVLLDSAPAIAEPAFAVRTGYRCSQCHANRTGGGGRTAFGSIYSQTILPARTLRWRDEGNLLPADPDARFSVGADVRAQFVLLRTDEGDDSSSVEIPEANLYAEVRLLPGKLSLYLDERMGPGGASAREVFGLWSFAKWNAYLKAGKFLPSYGWRLPDDEAFIRQFSGFTYTAPDQGVEFGIEPGRWSVSLGATNGSGGGSDVDRDKKFILSASHRFGSRGRLGLSAANNVSGGVTVTQAGLFGALQFGRLGLLAEGDWVERSSSQDTDIRWLAYFEANLLVSRGFTIKFAHDWIDPDRDVPTDARQRSSLGVEYIPYPFFRVRAYLRSKDGPPSELAGSTFVQGSRDDQLELELHFFF